MNPIDKDPSAFLTHENWPWLAAKMGGIRWCVLCNLARVTVLGWLVQEDWGRIRLYECRVPVLTWFTCRLELTRLVSQRAISSEQLQLWCRNMPIIARPCLFCSSACVVTGRRWSDGLYIEPLFHHLLGPCGYRVYLCLWPCVVFPAIWPV